MLKKLLAAHQSNKTFEIYKHYKNVFVQLANQVINRDAFGKFDILYWLNNKLKFHIEQLPLSATNYE